ncbi:MAG: DUF5123 domain-containing protein [Chitinivibrionales bacterium]|nr:DUF5123 domain-containing protein [Chitinivibrionales bacterium]MBD3396303.1 DUF5123 domain-containing protein [Chitinivibrionales bacterium]
MNNRWRHGLVFDSDGGENCSRSHNPLVDRGASPLTRKRDRSRVPLPALGLREGRACSIPALVILLSLTLRAATLHVGPGHSYAHFGPAANAAYPGDTILIHGGTYGGGQYANNLKGTPGNWIHVRAAEGEDVIVEGGGEAWHLSDPAYVRIDGITFRHQTANGVNVDDGGSYDTPAHHVVFENCVFRDMNATGNNDLLKLSGLDDFQIRACTFLNGSDGGSGVDMVGCHHGLIAANRFENMGSNGIQAKGGTHHITIHRNLFKNAGRRAVNLGGSTGLDFFRPETAGFEARNLYVFSNVFVGARAPIAYVTCVDVHVINNTIYQPDNWVIRILQEQSDLSRFLSCGDNVFRNNIIYLGNDISTEVNIGPDTRPETFTFSNNLWYNHEDAQWSGPSLPVTDANSMVGSDPGFADPATGDFSIDASSPAAGAGMDVSLPDADYTARAFASPRSIGAYEADPAAAIAGSCECDTWQEGHPEWIFCDDFENDDPLVASGRYFEYGDNDGDFVPVDGIGYGGSRGMRMEFEAGEVGAGGMKLAFGRNPNSYMNRQQIRPDEDFREIYYRMYLRMQDGWEGSPAKLSRATVFASPGDWRQAMIAHLWSDDQERLLIDPASCVENGDVLCTAYNDFPHLNWLGYQSGITPVFDSAHDDTWFCIEHHVKLNDPGETNGVQEFWIDGTLEARRDGLDFTGTYTEYAINAVFFENYWNDGSPKEQQRYFDNIVVSTERIGCLDAAGGRQYLPARTPPPGGVPQIRHLGSMQGIEIRIGPAHGTLPITVTIHDPAGRLVARRTFFAPGPGAVRWRPPLPAAGMYIVRSHQAGRAHTRLFSLVN